MKTYRAVVEIEDSIGYRGGDKVIKRWLIEHLEKFENEYSTVVGKVKLIKFEEVKKQ